MSKKLSPFSNRESNDKRPERATKRKGDMSPKRVALEKTEELSNETMVAYDKFICQTSELLLHQLKSEDEYIKSVVGVINKKNRKNKNNKIMIPITEYEMYSSILSCVYELENCGGDATKVRAIMEAIKEKERKIGSLDQIGEDLDKVVQGRAQQKHESFESYENVLSYLYSLRSQYVPRIYRDDGYVMLELKGEEQEAIKQIEEDTKDAIESFDSLITTLDKSVEGVSIQDKLGKAVLADKVTNSCEFKAALIQYCNKLTSHDHLMKYYRSTRKSNTSNQLTQLQISRIELQGSMGKITLFMC